MTVMCGLGSSAVERCNTEVEGFLLSSLNLKIRAEPSFFCPLTGSLLLSPVRLVNSGSTFEAKTLTDYFKRAGHKQCPISGRSLDKDWVVIEPDDELRARICAWAEKKCVNLDALEVATAKLRRHRLTDMGSPAWIEDHHMAGRPLESGHCRLRKPSYAPRSERQRSRSAPRSMRSGA